VYSAPADRRGGAVLCRAEGRRKSPPADRETTEGPERETTGAVERWSTVQDVGLQNRVDATPPADDTVQVHATPAPARYHPPGILWIPNRAGASGPAR
jgi:hypothetical protein